MSDFFFSLFSILKQIKQEQSSLKEESSTDDTPDGNFEKTKLLLLILLDSLKEARFILERGVYFYIFMISLIIAYVSKTSINHSNKMIISVFLCIITIFVFICVVLLYLGIYKGLTDVREIIKVRLKINNHDYPNAIDFIDRGITYGKYIGILACLFMALLVVGSIALIFILDN